MFLAYIDEIGEPGAFISHEHPRYRTSAAFGYAGFIIPVARARDFSAHFQNQKKTLWKREIAEAQHPGRWEKKGSEIFTLGTRERYPEQLRIFNSLVDELKRHDGRLFYYADEKATGTPRQVNVDPAERETRAMRECLNRLARHVSYAERDGEVMVIMDQVNEKTRRQRVAEMYSHIFGRAGEHEEMRRIVEPPMHLESVLSANIQFADWVAACVSRAIDFQLVANSQQGWITEERVVPAVRGAFTYESKLHLHNKSVRDLDHSEVFRRERPLYPRIQGHLVADGVRPEIMRRMKAAAERNHRKTS